MLADLTLKQLLDRFASSDPTPGGGSAAAMTGALGASLLAMVAGMSKTRTGTPEERTALDAARVELLRHRDTLVDLIDRDAQAYELVVAAYRRPKATDEEKAARKAAVQDAMRIAAETPLETMRVCSQVMDQGAIVAQHGNRNAKSDIAVGMQLLVGGMQGGAMNVAVNLDAIEDRALQESLAKSATGLMRGIHESMGRTATAANLADLYKPLMKHMDQTPSGVTPTNQFVFAALEGLCRLGTPEAKQAIELLARSADGFVAGKAREALDRFGA